MNKTAEFKLVPMMLAILTAFGLFFGLIGYTIGAVDGQYDIAGYDSSDLTKYNYLDDINSRAVNASSTIDGVRVSSKVFDWFAGIWDKLTSPFRLIFNSYGNLVNISDDVVNDLHLPNIYKAYFNAAIIILVVIGLVMIKYYLGRKN